MLTDRKVFEPKPDDQRILPSAPAREIRVVCSREGRRAVVSLVGADGRSLATVDHRLVYHSPDGFEWGYGGSGPSELALNLLACFVPPGEAWRLHQPFKWQFLAGMDKQGGAIEAGEITKWIRDRWARGDGPAPEVGS